MKKPKAVGVWLVLEAHDAHIVTCPVSMITTLRTYELFTQEEILAEQKDRMDELECLDTLVEELSENFDDGDWDGIVFLFSATADDVIDADATDDELELFVTNALWVHPRLRSMQAHIERVLGIRRDGK